MVQQKLLNNAITIDEDGRITLGALTVTDVFEIKGINPTNISPGDVLSSETSAYIDSENALFELISLKSSAFASGIVLTEVSDSATVTNKWGIYAASTDLGDGGLAFTVGANKNATSNPTVVAFDVYGCVIFQNTVDSAGAFRIFDKDNTLTLAVDTILNKTTVRKFSVVDQIEFDSQTLTSVSIGASDNDKLVTQGYVDDLIAAERKVTTVNDATYTILNTDKIIHVTYTATGAVTLTLPVASTVYNSADNTSIIYDIKDGGLNALNFNITIQGQSGATIDGAASVVLNTNGEGVSLYTDGTNWFRRP